MDWETRGAGPSAAASIALGPAVASAVCGGWTRQLVDVEDGALVSVHGHDGWEPVAIRGAIRDKWYELGAESSALGCPVRAEYLCADGRGRCSEFVTAEAADADLRATGAIVCNPEGTTHMLQGAIWRTWLDRGSVAGIGYPVCDEFVCSDGVGRFSQFLGTRRVRIYHTPLGGLHVVGDPIYSVWQEHGGESGALGYPIGDEEEIGSGVRVRFERGEIRWTLEGGADVVGGPPA